MRRFSLFQKILVAFLALSLVPLLVSSAILALNLGTVREMLTEQIATTADRQACESLRLRAEQVAGSVASFLEGCEADLLLCASLPHTPAILKAVYDSRGGEIWRRDGTAAAPREVREWIPRYSSLAIIARDGQETFVIRDGAIVPRTALRNVANPADTEFRSEEYFRRARELKRGEVYVSRLTGFHVGKQEQLAGATEPEEAYGGKEYRGVIRFATPLFDNRGNFDGIVVLSLDHRHLMEFSQHISPGQNRLVVFPSYRSGNYAFLFDDEGWIITHPKFWDIRGVDGTGKLVPPYRADTPPDDVAKGRIPFNLDYAGFIHPNYPRVAQMVRERKSGYVDITNVGGAKKIMAFAPIPYSTGDYRRHGIFGAVTIGFQVDQFRETARTGAALINEQLRAHLRLSIIILAATSLMVVVCAWLLSRGVTRPLALLAEGVRRLAGGETGSRVAVTTHDEIGELADSFNRMAQELETRKNNLLNTLEELQRSRRHIMEERNFKESVLESISSAIMTLSPGGLLTSINGTGKRILGDGARIGTHYGELFSGWGEMVERVRRALANRSGYGREMLMVERDGKALHLDVGLFPIHGGEDEGITVTMRDETEKEELRKEMTRLDRFASLGKLAAGIAHEVRNPLTGISLLLDDLHDRAGLDPDNQLLMRKALQEIERVERLIAALLNFSSPPKADFREGDLNRVISDTLLLLRRQCEQQRVELSFAPGELPIFRFDIEKIKQALLNLIKNALEAMPAGGTIAVRTATSSGTATITVTDSGPGIPAADLRFIFEPFFTRKGAGTGLGLSITQRIVEEHHGRIAAESRTGEGTTFTITLPVGG